MALPEPARAEPGPAPGRAALWSGDRLQPKIVWTAFSRNLQWVVTAEQAHANPFDAGVLVGEKARALGFSAVDLTVRPDGLVDPGRDDLAFNLPAMLRGVRSTGAACDQITTNIEFADKPLAQFGGRQIFAEDVLRVAAAHGVRLYRWGGFTYDIGPDARGTPQPFGRQVLAQLDAFAARSDPLAKLNGVLGLTAIYHTYSGGNNPRSVWDLMAALAPYPPSQLAINFDIGHMTCEGALSAWSTNLRYAMPRVLGVGLKDGLVSRKPDGGAGSQFVPAGSGLVQWPAFFQLLLEGGFQGPAQAQYEFSVTGLKGQTVSLNTTFWADHPQLSGGNLTADFLDRQVLNDLEFYKHQAREAGWRSDQMT
ncbi:MAG TPA: TIM barrel protein [Caulobacteraceae bacterium]|nr:TIM barrel protein [Caulobacteraceae bacterium]